MQHGIALEDIYNFDETGFAIGLVATAKVVTRVRCLVSPSLSSQGTANRLYL
jgi:hypothetical protein